MIDNLFTTIDEFWHGCLDMVNQPVDHYCMLETSNNDTEFCTTTGAFVSLFEYKGTMTQIGASEYEIIIQRLAESLNNTLSATNGVGIQIVYSYNPDDIGRVVDEIYEPSEKSAQKFNLDIDEILCEKKDKLKSLCAVESCYIAVWTKPGVLPSADRKRALKRLSKSYKINNIPGTQRVEKVLHEIANDHITIKQQVKDAFGLNNLILDPLSTHRALWVMRKMICPEFTGIGWKALLPGDPIPLRFHDPGQESFYSILYPSIPSQLFPKEAYNVEKTIVKIGDFLHAPMTVTLPPQNPRPFQMLFKTIQEKRIPWRISFLIEPDGLRGMGFKTAIAQLLQITSSENKILLKSIKDLEQRMIEGEPPVKIKIALDTWTLALDKEESLNRVKKQAAMLTGAIQGWGTCDTTQFIGDPLLGVCATIPGLMDKSPAPAAAAPLAEVMKLIPLRPVSVWDQGSMLLRTPDGKIFPYQPMSSKQSAWVDVGVAPMGKGKSVYLNTYNLGYILQPGLEELPWLSILDIGPSSSGLIKMIKESLPPQFAYLAETFKLRMTPEYATNPFDTPLGARRPVPLHNNFLCNLLNLFATPLNENAPNEAVPGIVRVSIEKTYERLEDSNNPKKYSAGILPDVDELLKKLDYLKDENTSWWEVTDFLFQKGHIEEASITQRYAVPTISDVIGTCHQSPEIAAMYGEKIVSTFSRYLSESIQAYPILSSPTQFNVGEARILSLDLDEVTQRGGASADRQNAVMYMLGRHIVGNRFFLREEDLCIFPSLYHDYQEKVFKRIKQIPKRLCYDEVHRVTKNKSVAQQLVSDMETTVRESRKWNLSIGLYTQSITDLPDILVDLATMVIFLGGGTAKNIKNICETFGFNSAINYSLQNILKPDHRGANFVAYIRTDVGDIVQTLTNTIGAQLLWAFSTTTEDMVVRDELYKFLGIKKALKILAETYPGGVKEDIERLKVTTSTGYDSENSLYTTIINELVERVKYGKKTT